MNGFKLASLDLAVRDGLVDDFERVRATLKGNQGEPSASKRRVHDRPAIGLDRAFDALKSLWNGHPRSYSIRSPNAACLGLEESSGMVWVGLVPQTRWSTTGWRR